MSGSPAYLATTDFNWTERAFELLAAGRLTVADHAADGVSGVVVSGPCPRCDHHFVDRRSLDALTGLAGVSRNGDSEPSDIILVDVTCVCGTSHEGAPEGVTGCGVSFRIELKRL
ncbi:hypothetical protein [Streptomyces sp. NPDC007205]|uniref:hypothetical protein n=1 Tax=Streptomyces sp. NPDC007205 TaxID=3154316 RepID=UPI0033D8A164